MAQAVIDKDRLDIMVEYGSNYASYNPDNDNYDTSTTKTEYENNSLEYAIDNGHTYLDATATATAELPLGYAHVIDSDTLLYSIGGNIKPMRVESYHQKLSIDTASDSIGDDLEDSKKSTTTVTADLGLLMQHKATGINMGLVAKNITSPEFDLANTDEKLEYEPAYRAGVSYKAFDMLEIAVDADLNEQDAALEGLSTQYIGGGVEFAPSSWFAVRGGLMQNVASESIDEGMIYSGGLSFGLKWFQTDLSAMVSQESGEYDGTSIPRFAKIDLSFISRW